LFKQEEGVSSVEGFGRMLNGQTTKGDFVSSEEGKCPQKTARVKDSMGIA
jgi:hypothetical protein